MTPNEAAELMRRSQVGGVSTSEFAAGGGYAAVKKLAEGNTTGYQAGVSTVADRAKYAPNDAIVRFDPAGQGGLGETFYASGNSATGGTALTNTGAATTGAATTGAATTGAADTAVGYSGLAGTNKSGFPSTRDLVELSTGRKIDTYFYDKTNPNYAANQLALTRATAAIYGDVGANLDARNWTAIMASKDPLKAAEDALKAMYSDKAYLAANADALLTKGYLPEQADLTYQQMTGRVGSKYDSNWSKGTKFEGKYNTVSYLNNASALKGDQLASYEDNLWTQWGGNPIKNRGVVDAGATSSTSVTTPTAFAPAPGKLTGAATVTPGSVSTPAATSTAQTAPVQLNAPVASGGAGLLTGANTLTSGGNSASTGNNTPSTGGTGLLTGANTLAPGTFNIGNTSTGNVNTGGLITGAQQQMFTQNAQVGLPTGVTPTIGAMGNNTGGASITPYNPYKFTGTGSKTGTSKNWYNPKTGQRYTALPGYTPPSTDWVTY
jgi:hypothetical protein